jgi:hypothetical protein
MSQRRRSREEFKARLRIPGNSATQSEGKRPPIPGNSAGQSERSDAGMLDIS